MIRSSFCVLTLAAAMLPSVDAAFAQSPAHDFLDVKFRGGTAMEYVDALRSAAPHANIVVLNDISSISLPPITLRQVTLRSAVELLEDCTDNAIRPTVALDVEHDPAEEDVRAYDVFTVEAHSISRQRPASLETSVFSVGHLIDSGFSADDILGAIDIALAQLQDDYPDPDVKFHEPTSLVIARGRDAQLQAMTRVVGSIEETAARRSKAKAEAEDIQRARQQNAQLIAELDQLRAELKKRETMTTDLNVERQMARQEIDALQHRLADQRDEIDKLRHTLAERSKGGER